MLIVSKIKSTRNVHEYTNKQTCLFGEFLRSQAASTCYLPYPKLRPAPKSVVALRNMAKHHPTWRGTRHPRQKNGQVFLRVLFQSWDLQQELILWWIHAAHRYRDIWGYTQYHPTISHNDLELLHPTVHPTQLVQFSWFFRTWRLTIAGPWFRIPAGFLSHLKGCFNQGDSVADG